jgi:hypothetical protein
MHVFGFIIDWQARLLVVVGFKILEDGAPDFSPAEEQDRWPRCSRRTEEPSGAT